jgi:hypothetical protein
VKIRPKRRLRQIALDLGTVAPAAFSGDLEAARTFLKLLRQEANVMKCGVSTRI